MLLLCTTGKATGRSSQSHMAYSSLREMGQVGALHCGRARCGEPFRGHLALGTRYYTLSAASRRSDSQRFASSLVDREPQGKAIMIELVRRSARHEILVTGYVMCDFLKANTSLADDDDVSFGGCRSDACTSGPLAWRSRPQPGGSHNVLFGSSREAATRNMVAMSELGFVNTAVVCSPSERAGYAR